MPLYIKLYDDSIPQLRPRLEVFLKKMTAKLENEGFKVDAAPFCRIESEFSENIAKDVYKRQFEYGRIFRQYNAL